MSSVSGGRDFVMVRKVSVSGRQVLSTLLPVVLCVLLCCSVGAEAKRKRVAPESEGEGKNGNFSQSPTNHEEVLTKSKDTDASPSNDDFWVGTHQVEFKPHPFLMPSTLAPQAQIPIPLIELGLPPTLTPDGLPSEEMSEEDKQGKQRKSRDKRKKSRDQRRLTHRSLWANTSNNNAYIMQALQNNPQILQQYPYANLHQPFPQPMILTAGGMAMATPIQPPYMVPPPPLAGKNDESFHGSASTWNVNHPGNQLQNYYAAANNENNANNNAAGDNSQENRFIQQQYPRSASPAASMQNFHYGYPHMQQSLQLPQHYSSQQPYPISAPDSDFYANPSQAPGQSPLGNNGGGPILVYVTPSGRGITQASASGPIPLKAYNSLNEIPIDIGSKPHLHYNPNYVTGPTGGGHHGHGNSHGGQNPQYTRNNFLRMFMDKLASVGKHLPIPFVTKYSHHPQGYGRHVHMINRRM